MPVKFLRRILYVYVIIPWLGLLALYNFSSAASLEDVQVDAFATHDMVNIILSAPVQYRVFELAAPDRLVIDLEDCVILSEPGQISFNTNFIKTIRSAQYRAEPVKITRTVIDLQHPVSYSVTAVGSDIFIELTPKVLELSPPAPALSEPPVQRVVTQSIRTPAESERVCVLENIFIESESDYEKLIMVLSSRPLYNITALDAPPCVIVDLKDCRYWKEQREIPVATKLIKNIQAEEYKDEKTRETNVMIRIFLKKNISYEAAALNKAIVLTLIGNPGADILDAGAAAEPHAVHSALPPVSEPPGNMGLHVPAKKGISIGGYTQFMYTDDAAPGMHGVFNLKRARVAFKYRFNDKYEFKIQPDFAPAASGGAVLLREAWLELPVGPAAELRIGQYHQPFGFENCYSSSLKKLADAPHYMTAVLPSDYDYGVQLWGGIGADDFIAWRCAVMNGTGSGVEDNRSKDISWRVVLKPEPEVEFGISWYRGYFGPANSGVSHYGGYFKFEQDAPLPLFFTAEYVGGDDKTASNKAANVIITLETRPFIYNSRLDDLAPVIRYERWDPCRRVKDDESVNITVGCNYYPAESVRLLVDYVIKTESPEIDNNRFNCMLQVKY